MKPHSVVERYFAAWNQQDSAQLSALLGDSGRYRDPLQVTGLNGAGLAAYADALWVAFPDLRFEYGEVLAGASGRLACEWIYVGRFQAPLLGLPPHGREVRFEGVDVFEPSTTGLQLVWGHYDAIQFFELLTT